MIGRIDIEKTLQLQPNKECLFVSVATILNELVDTVNELQTKVNKLVSNINFAQPEVKENMQDDHYWFKQQKRYKAALVLIRDLTGGGMSYYDIVIEMREIAKWALDPNHQPLLIGRYDKETSELLDILGETKGGDNE